MLPVLGCVVRSHLDANVVVLAEPKTAERAGMVATKFQSKILRVVATIELNSQELWREELQVYIGVDGEWKWATGKGCDGHTKLACESGGA